MALFQRACLMAASLLAVGMALYHMYIIWFGVPDPYLFRATHLLLAIVLTFLWYRRTTISEAEIAKEGGAVLQRGPTIPDLVLAGLAAAPIFYLFLNYEYFINRIYYVDDLSIADMTMGVLMIVLIIEASRRLMGWALPLTAMAFLTYGLLIARMEPERLIDQLYMTTEGIFGIPLGVSATYVIIFVLFGSFMERTGTGKLFMDVAMSMTGHSAGGPGKVAVVSSSMFGSISGSAVANVMVTGQVSIPLMKRTGFSPQFSGAVEAVASTGGQIMPPIMGAAAFVMAEFMGVSYAQVVVWAIMPALLFYFACFASVHFEAKRLGLVGVPRSQLPALGATLRERGHMFLPVIIILAVIYAGYSAPLAAFAGTLACFPVAAMRSTTRDVVTVRNFVEALIDGVKNSLAVALACACAGIVIGIVTLSGLGIVFTQLVVNIAQSTLLLALILTMIAGIVLGMGMPTTPAYIIMAALLIPAIIALGVERPAAHMFAFYFAIMSAITPPVALAVYAASGLAKSDIWKTGWQAVKVGSAGFIVPFMFVYEPALLMIGDWQTIAHVAITATTGCILLAAGLIGYLIMPANLIQRALLLTGAFALINPGLITDLIGFGTSATVIAWQYAARKAAAGAAVSAASGGGSVTGPADGSG